MNRRFQGTAVVGIDDLMVEETLAKPRNNLRDFDIDEIRDMGEYVRENIQRLTGYDMFFVGDCEICGRPKKIEHMRGCQYTTRETETDWIKRKLDEIETDYFMYRNLTSTKTQLVRDCQKAQEKYRLIREENLTLMVKAAQYDKTKRDLDEMTKRWLNRHEQPEGNDEPQVSTHQAQLQKENTRAKQKVRCVRKTRSEEESPTTMRRQLSICDVSHQEQQQQARERSKSSTRTLNESTTTQATASTQPSTVDQQSSIHQAESVEELTIQDESTTNQQSSTTNNDRNRRANPGSPNYESWDTIWDETTRSNSSQEEATVSEDNTATSGSNTNDEDDDVILIDTSDEEVSDTDGEVVVEPVRAEPQREERLPTPPPPPPHFFASPAVRVMVPEPSWEDMVLLEEQVSAQERQAQAQVEHLAAELGQLREPSGARPKEKISKKLSSAKSKPEKKAKKHRHRRSSESSIDTVASKEKRHKRSKEKKEIRRSPVRRRTISDFVESRIVPGRAKKLGDKKDDDPTDKEDEKEEEKDKEKSKAGRKKTSYPRLHELGPSYTLKHQTEGPLCGGSVDEARVERLWKKVKTIDFAKNKPGETSYDAYERAEAEFITTVEDMSSEGLTIYDILSCFSQLNKHHMALLRPLKQKKCYFTSFVHFLREWKRVRFPNEKFQGMHAAECCEQKPKESIDSYYERYNRIKHKLGMQEELKVDWFISGLYNKKVKDECQAHNFGDDRTIESVREYALGYLQRIGMGEAMNEKRKNISQEHHSANVSSTKTAQKKKVSSSKVKSSTKSKTPKEVAATYSFDPTRKFSPKKQTNAAPSKSPKFKTFQDSSPIRASNGYKPKMSGPFKVPKPPPPKTKNPGTTWTQKRKAAKAWQEEKQVEGCFVCMGDHYATADYRTCHNACPFCQTKFSKGQARHWAYECNRRPNTAAQIKAVAKAHNHRK